MNNAYDDIRSRIPEPPIWWDENAVPRYVPFTPRETANIYAREAVLLLIECQACGRAFHVCMSWGSMDLVYKRPTLAEQIRNGSIHYGDPPNAECCSAGPTMNSEPRKVLEYWKEGALVGPGERWVRDAALEIAVDAEWAKHEASP